MPTAITGSSGKITLSCVAGTRQLKVFHDRFGSKVIPVNVSGEKLSVRVRLENPAAIIVEDEAHWRVSDSACCFGRGAKKIPGTFGDPVQALQVLPGVARPNIAEGSIVVRGAEELTPAFMSMECRFHICFIRWYLARSSFPHLLMTLNFSLEECPQNTEKSLNL